MLSRRRGGARLELILHGPLAQLVERHVYTVDVVGSIPAGPTALRPANAPGRGLGWWRECQPRRPARPPRRRRLGSARPSRRGGTSQSAAGRARRGATAQRTPESRRSWRSGSASVTTCSVELSRMESDVAVAEARRARDADDSPPRATSKDAQGLEHELGCLKQRRSDLEDAELDVMERLEQADAAVAAQRGRDRRDERRGISCSARRQGRRRRGDRRASERPPATARRSSHRCPAELVAYYDKVAAAQLRRRALHPRHVRGLPHGALRHRSAGAAKRPEDRIVTCPECGCILVRTEESGL